MRRTKTTTYTTSLKTRDLERMRTNAALTTRGYRRCVCMRPHRRHERKSGHGPPLICGHRRFRRLANDCSFEARRQLVQQERGQDAAKEFLHRIAFVAAGAVFVAAKCWSALHRRHCSPLLASNWDYPHDISAKPEAGTRVNLTRTEIFASCRKLRRRPLNRSPTEN